MRAGKKVAIKKEKNKRDWITKELKNSFGISTPTNKLLEKSGKGKIKIPAKSPKIIAMYAFFSLILLL